MDTSKRIEQTLFCPVPFCSWFSKEVFEILNSTGVGMCGITVISIQASKLHMTSTHRAFLLLPQALEKRAQLTSRAWSHHFLGWDNLHFGGPSVGAEWEREGKLCLLLPIFIGAMILLCFIVLFGFLLFCLCLHSQVFYRISKEHSPFSWLFSFLSTNLPKLFTSLVLYLYYILVAQGRPPRLMLLVVYALQLFRSTTVLQAFCTE